MTNLLGHVEQSILVRKLLKRGQRILVAVSGGLDSVVLLHLLRAVAVKHRWKLMVAHLNHQLRGRESEGDERFVRSLGKRLKLPCVVERADVRAHAKAHGTSIEMAARELRHEFLARNAKRQRTATVALAHHADDQVELFFLRLLRGTGSDGLAGMKWRARSPADFTVSIVRPLLDVSRHELQQFATENKIRFREDSSNATCDILRNRIRHELLPLLRRRYQPAVNKTVLRLMEIGAAELEVLSETTKVQFKTKSRPFNSLPIAIQRRVLQAELHRHGLAADFDLIEQLRGTSNRRVSVNPRVVVSRNQTGVVKLELQTPTVFNSNQTELTLHRATGEREFDAVRIQWRIGNGKRAALPKPKSNCESFDADRVGAEIILRHWRAGDRFQPIGLHSPVKLQDWFTNQKISRGRRHELVIAATAAGEIFWIEGQRISDRFKITPETKRRLIWRWERS